MRKINPPKPTAFLWSIFFVLLISSCYTVKKAEKQQDKVIDRFPEIAAKKMIERFPRVTVRDTIINTVVDSAGFLLSIREIEEAGWIIDSLQGRINALSNDTKETCIDFVLLNDALKSENKRLKNVKPVIIYRDKIQFEEDSSKIFLAEKERDGYKEKYAIDHDWRVLKEKKEKGKLVILIPWWLIIFILVAGAGFVFLGIKNKTFNLVKLATKTISYVSKKKKEETRPQARLKTKT